MSLSMETQIYNFREQLRKNARFRLEILAAISEVCRNNSIVLSDELLCNIQFAVPKEISKEVHIHSIDPPQPEGPAIDPLDV